MALLVLAFVVVPLVEIAVIVKVGSVIGIWNALGLLLVVSMVGGWLVKREGLGVIRRVQTAVEAGRVPGRELVDGLLVVVAGALLLAPGFVTDAFGLLLLLPPVRAVVRRRVARRLTLRATGGYIDV